MKKKKKVMENKTVSVLIMIFNIIITLIVILLLLVVLVQKLSNNKMNFGGLSIYTVASGSMDPVYKTKDLILVKEVDPSTLEVGDDVVYLGKKESVKGKIVTHRIIEVNELNGERKYVTKGIANDIKDPEITGDQIIGKVVKKLTLLSLCSHLINNKFGFFFLIFIPFACFLFYETVEITHILKKYEK